MGAIHEPILRKSSKCVGGLDRLVRMLSQSVAASIRSAISDGYFSPGQQLSEVKAAERFHCSRNTLREAFSELTAERLVTRIPNRGVFIATPDAAFVKDLFTARAAIEPAAVLWGEFPNPSELVDLASSAQAHVEAEEHQVISSINQNFHRRLVAGLGSPTLDEQMDNLLARMRLTFLLALPRYPSLHVEHVPGNIRLAEYIAAGERDAAAAVAREALLATCRRILAVL